MKWRELIPTLFTMAAMLSGFLSILMAIEGIRTDCPVPYYRWAAQLIMLSMILDGLDGNIARLLKGTSEFGAELDTYVDLTAFGIAPAILIFAVTLQTKDPVWRILLPSAVALSGVVRLARFKVQDPFRGQAGYAGLPITVNAGWVALLVFISQAAQNKTEETSNVFSLGHGLFATLFLTGVFIFIILQITNLRYPKPTKKVLLFAPCVVLVFLLLFLRHHMAEYVAFILLFLGLVYIIAGPFFVKSIALHKARKEAKNAETNGK